MGVRITIVSHSDLIMIICLIHLIMMVYLIYLIMIILHAFQAISLTIRDYSVSQGLASMYRAM